MRAQSNDAATIYIKRMLFVGRYNLQETHPHSRRPALLHPNTSLGGSATDLLVQWEFKRLVLPSITSVIELNESHTFLYVVRNLITSRRVSIMAVGAQQTPR